MMRIAVAGGTGLGSLLASGLSQAEEAYNERPELEALDIQTHVVDYHNHESLCFALHGIDLVISTISGNEQLNLIHAAGQTGVRLFVPSEFEGPLANRPAGYDPLDRGTSQAITILRQYSSSMKYTVFSCGVFMERFCPNGLGYYGIGYGSGVSNPGDYLIDINNATTDFVEKDRSNHTVHVSLTSVYDVVRFIVAAVALGPGTWPREYTMRGDRMSLRNLVGACGRAWNMTLTHQRHQHADLDRIIDEHAQRGDVASMTYFQRLQATANGRYDFHRPSLNRAVDRSDQVQVRPMTFSEWLASMQAS